MPPLACADSYRAFRNFRQVEPNGRYYVVVKKNGGPEDPGDGTPVTFEIVERKPGSPPVTPAEDGDSDDAFVAHSDVNVRKGDIVLGRGNLNRCPGRILISSTGTGFVGLDVRGYNYGDLRSGNALVIVSTSGDLRHRKDLIDLFSREEIDQFIHTAGGILVVRRGLDR